MARLEYIDFKPWREVIENSSVGWVLDTSARAVPRLPQIFWSNGDGWPEANHWALEKATQMSISIQTVQSLMKHLHAYADWLEVVGMDWRHFPIRLSERVTVRFRGHVVEEMARGSLSSSTASARMRALVQFYRHCNAQRFIDPGGAMWVEKPVVLNYYDPVGFKRSILRITTDLAIRNTARPGVRLEDGLTPLRSEHMEQLLRLTAKECLEELHLMLTTGFYTGARIGTITTLRIENLEGAVPDPYLKGFARLPVGPGTGVSTKLNVSGDLLVPDFLLDALKAYAYSPRRLKREAKSNPSNRSVVFLTNRGNAYAQASVNREMTELRRKALKANLRFMERFKFHQTRATYGTWLMTLALRVTTPAAAIEFVKSAMLHKHEVTTWGYIRFLEVSKAKQEMADAFTHAFTGIGARDWDGHHA
jgi:integrase